MLASGDLVGFHRRATSDSLVLSGSGQAVASRRGIPRGIAIGRSPCHRKADGSKGFSIVVRAVEAQHFSSGLWLGMTLTTPDHLAAMNARGEPLDFAADVPDCFSAGGEGYVWDGQEFLEARWDTGRLVCGDEIDVFVSPHGKFSVSVNGRSVISGLQVSIPVGKPLYPLVELHGATQAVELLRGEAPVPPLLVGAAGLAPQPSGESLPTSASTSARAAQHKLVRDSMLRGDCPVPPLLVGATGLAPQPSGESLPSSASTSARVVQHKLRCDSTGRGTGGIAGLWERPRTPPHAHTPPQTPLIVRAVAPPPPLSSCIFEAGASKATGSRASLTPSESRSGSSLASPRALDEANAMSKYLPAFNIDMSAPSAQPRGLANPSGEQGIGRSRASPPLHAAAERRANLGSRTPGSTSSQSAEPGEGSSLRGDTPQMHELQHQQEHGKAYQALCQELAATRSQRDSIQARLHETSRSVVVTAAEGKRREQEIRQLRKELKAQGTKLEESQRALTELDRRTADAQAAKNRAQHQAWRLQQKLHEKEAAEMIWGPVRIPSGSGGGSGGHSRPPSSGPPRRPPSAAAPATVPPTTLCGPTSAEAAPLLQQPLAQVAVAAAASAAAGDMSAKDETMSAADESTTCSSPRGGGCNGTMLIVSDVSAPAPPEAKAVTLAEAYAARRRVASQQKCKAKAKAKAVPRSGGSHRWAWPDDVELDSDGPDPC